MKKLFLLIFFLLNTGFLHAEEIIELSDNHWNYFVTNENVSIYKDSTQLLSPKQILNFKKTIRSNSIDYEEHRNWKTSNFWFKFTVKNNSSKSIWFLEIPDLHIQKISFYDILNDSLQEAGYLENFKIRHYQHKNFIYELNILPGQSRTYLVKMSSTIGYGTNMKIYSGASLISYATKEYILLGLYYGFLILSSIYVLFIFLGSNDKAYIFYFFYILALGLRSLLEDGLGFQFLWPSNPKLNLFFTYLSPPLFSLTFSLYAIVFFELKQRFINYYKYLIYALLFYIIYYLITFFFPVPYSEIIFLIPFIVIYTISILTYKNGYKPARFFILGYSLFIVSLFIFYLRSIGYLSFANEFLIVLSVYSINIGFAVEVIIFSISLADKIKHLRKEKDQMLTEKNKDQLEIINQLKINEELKDKVNQELEFKISERTKDLAEKSSLLKEANEKLSEQAEKINKMNQALDIENYKLKNYAKDLNVDRRLLKAISLEEFIKSFPEETACYRFIEELKWSDGYKCRKCGNEKFMKGKNVFSRKCTKCTYNESIKANTIFHDIKFPIEKAFQLIYLTLIKDGVSTYELAEKLDLRQKTCWAFRKRILEKMEKENITNKIILEKGWSILICEH
jgi:two-component system, sensor histidine kinase LadS